MDTCKQGYELVKPGIYKKVTTNNECNNEEVLDKLFSEKDRKGRRKFFETHGQPVLRKSAIIRAVKASNKILSSTPHPAKENNCFASSSISSISPITVSFPHDKTPADDVQTDKLINKSQQARKRLNINESGLTELKESICQKTDKENEAKSQNSSVIFIGTESYSHNIAEKDSKQMKASRVFSKKKNQQANTKNSKITSQIPVCKRFLDKLEPKTTTPCSEFVNGARQESPVNDGNKSVHTENVDESNTTLTGNNNNSRILSLHINDASNVAGVGNISETSSRSSSASSQRSVAARIGDLLKETSRSLESSSTNNNNRINKLCYVAISPFDNKIYHRKTQSVATNFRHTSVRDVGLSPIIFESDNVNPVEVQHVSNVADAQQDLPNDNPNEKLCKDTQTSNDTMMSTKGSSNHRKKIGRNSPAASSINEKETMSSSSGNGTRFLDTTYKRGRIFESLGSDDDLNYLDFSDSGEPDISAVNIPWRYENNCRTIRGSDLTFNLNFIKRENELLSAEAHRSNGAHNLSQPCTDDSEINTSALRRTIKQYSKSRGGRVCTLDDNSSSNNNTPLIALSGVSTRSKIFMRRNINCGARSLSALVGEDRTTRINLLENALASDSKVAENANKKHGVMEDFEAVKQIPTGKDRGAEVNFETVAPRKSFSNTPVRPKVTTPLSKATTVNENTEAPVPTQREANNTATRHKTPKKSKNKALEMTMDKRYEMEEEPPRKVVKKMTERPKSKKNRTMSTNKAIEGAENAGHEESLTAAMDYTFRRRTTRNRTANKTKTLLSTANESVMATLEHRITRMSIRNRIENEIQTSLHNNILTVEHAAERNQQTIKPQTNLSTSEITSKANGLLNTTNTKNLRSKNKLTANNNKSSGKICVRTNLFPASLEQENAEIAGYLSENENFDNFKNPQNDSGVIENSTKNKKKGAKGKLKKAGNSATSNQQETDISICQRMSPFLASPDARNAEIIEHLSECGNFDNLAQPLPLEPEPHVMPSQNEKDFGSIENATSNKKKGAKGRSRKVTDNSVLNNQQERDIATYQTSPNSRNAEIIRRLSERGNFDNLAQPLPMELEPHVMPSPNEKDSGNIENATSNKKKGAKGRSRKFGDNSVLTNQQERDTSTYQTSPNPRNAEIVRRLSERGSFDNLAQSLPMESEPHVMPSPNEKDSGSIENATSNKKKGAKGKSRKVGDNSILTNQQERNTATYQTSPNPRNAEIIRRLSERGDFDNLAQPLPMEPEPHVMPSQNEKYSGNIENATSNKKKGAKGKSRKVGDNSVLSNQQERNTATYQSSPNPRNAENVGCLSESGNFDNFTQPLPLELEPHIIPSQNQKDSAADNKKKATKRKSRKTGNNSATTNQQDIPLTTYQSQRPQRTRRQVVYQTDLVLEDVIREIEAANNIKKARNSKRITLASETNRDRSTKTKKIAEKKQDREKSKPNNVSPKKNNKKKNKMQTNNSALVETNDIDNIESVMDVQTDRNVANSSKKNNRKKNTTETNNNALTEPSDTLNTESVVNVNQMNQVTVPDVNNGLLSVDSGIIEGKSSTLFRTVDQANTQGDVLMNLSCNNSHNTDSFSERALVSVKKGSGVSKKSKPRNAAKKLVQRLEKSFERRADVSTSSGLNDNNYPIPLEQSSYTQNNTIGYSGKSGYCNFKYVMRTPQQFDMVTGLGMSEIIEEPSSLASLGYLKLNEGMTKVPHPTEEHALIFHVVDGEAMVYCHDSNSVVERGSVFAIPQGVNYTIKNNNSEALILAYTKVRAI